MDKLEVVKQLESLGVVAVIRGKTPEEAVTLSEACIAGGVKAIEVAFTTPMAQEAIRTLSEKYKTDAEVVIGAGTVLDSETARLAILYGAQFVVSPCFNEATIKLCNRYRVACMPGTTTIQGVVEALEFGADVVKVFPGEVVGKDFIKAVHGPLPQARLMPTGGVSLENLKDWIAVGCVAVGVGGALTGGGKTPAEITALAGRFAEEIKLARAK